ncbi:hypothetical protein ACQ0QQ_08345 [Lysinibacillus sphaericus]
MNSDIKVISLNDQRLSFDNPAEIDMIKMVTLTALHHISPMAGITPCKTVIKLNPQKWLTTDIILSIMRKIVLSR